MWWVHRVWRGPRGGERNPLEKASELMPVGHTEFNPERPRRGYSRQGKLGGRGQRQKGVEAALLEWVSVAGGKLLRGGGKRVGCRNRKGRLGDQ